MYKYFILILLLPVFVGCNFNGSSSYKNEVCSLSVINNDTLTACKDGQILLYSPERWGTGDTQSSIIYSAYVCDFDYPILYSTGALSCVYKRRYDAEKDIQKTNDNQADNKSQNSDK